MSGCGKGGKFRAKTKTRSARAGLQFPFGRVHLHLHLGISKESRIRGSYLANHSRNRHHQLASLFEMEVDSVASFPKASS